MIRPALSLLLLCAGCATAAPPADELYQQGTAALARGDQAAARSAFQRAAHTDPTLLEAQLNLAALDLEQGEVAIARQRLAPLSLGPDADPRARYLLALAQLEAGERDTALQSLENLADHQFPEAYYLLGQQYAAAGDFGEAEYCFTTYLELRSEGGFRAEVQERLAALDRLRHTDRDTEIPAEPLTGPEPEPDAAIEPPGEPEQHDPAPPAATPAPPATPVQPAKPPATLPVQTQPASDRADLSEDEKIWRDARFLEIVKKEHRRALAAYRKYLQLAPFGEHANGAREGILRCEAALQAGEDS